MKAPKDMLRKTIQFRVLRDQYKELEKESAAIHRTVSFVIRKRLFGESKGVSISTGGTPLPNPSEKK